MRSKTTLTGLIFLLIGTISIGIVFAETIEFTSYFPGPGGNFDRTHANKMTIGSGYNQAAVPNDPPTAGGIQDGMMLRALAPQT